MDIKSTPNMLTKNLLYLCTHFIYYAWSVPEVVRPLYESSTGLAQKTTMTAFCQLRQIAQDVSQSNVTNWGRQPAALRALSPRLSRGFNEALNGLNDEGWSLIGGDRIDEVTILVNFNPEKFMGLNVSFANGYTSICNAVLCAKASMLLQNVPIAILLRFLREHRSEWADNSSDAYSAAPVKIGPCSLLGSRVSNFGGQVILPLAETIKHEELLEVIKLEGGVGHSAEDALMPRDMFLLQAMCTKCSNVSNQFENMMDLAVEIHGVSGSLEECLDQFTAKEWLHGDNMYKCHGHVLCRAMLFYTNCLMLLYKDIVQLQ